MTVSAKPQASYGSMSNGARGNPYDNAKMESLMKTLKVEGVYPLEFETVEDVPKHLPALIKPQIQRQAPPLITWLPEPRTVREAAHPAAGQKHRLIMSDPKGPLQCPACRGPSTSRPDAKR